MFARPGFLAVGRGELRASGSEIGSVGAFKTRDQVYSVNLTDVFRCRPQRRCQTDVIETSRT